MRIRKICKSNWITCIFSFRFLHSPSRLPFCRKSIGKMILLYFTRLAQSDPKRVSRAETFTRDTYTARLCCAKFTVHNKLFLSFFFSFPFYPREWLRFNRLPSYVYIVSYCIANVVSEKHKKKQKTLYINNNITYRYETLASQ